MAGHWSSDCIQSEYRELQANAMAVDCHGQLALLAGRRTLAIVNLDDMQIVKKVPRQSKWEISAAEWNPHPSHADHFITACNQRADICTWSGDGGYHQQGSLKAHTRVISDLDWCPAKPETVATCSVDTFTYLWDIRDTRRPTTSLQAVAGASQVKWNRVNPHLLGTTHEGDIRIWDIRKGITPVQYIAGHLSIIHGLDWNPRNEHHLATSSQDHSVKFWDITNPRQAVDKVSSSSPVWRARYTPFGNGLVTVVVPQLRRGENSLFLYHLGNIRQHVHAFVGHTDVVLEFQWRKPDEDNIDFQLVTWSKDQNLRLWRIDAHLQALCGEEIDDGHPSIMTDLSLQDAVSLSMDTERNAEPSTNGSQSFVLEHEGLSSSQANGQDDNGLSSTPPNSGIPHKDDIHSPKQPKNLHNEFKLVNFTIPNIELKSMDSKKRTFTATVTSNEHVVELTMKFPDLYPNSIPPDFEFGKGTNIEKGEESRIIKNLSKTAMQLVSRNRPCIEPCLRQLVSNLDNLSGKPAQQTSDSTVGFSIGAGPSTLRHQTIRYNMYIPEATLDMTVPFPRTSGARFCGSGLLVCFTRKSVVTISRRTSSSADVTPRDMSVLSAFSSSSSRSSQGQTVLYHYSNMAQLGRSPPTDRSGSLNNYYTFRDKRLSQKPRQRTRTRTEDHTDHRTRTDSDSASKENKKGPVIIYDVSSLLPVHRQLGENYVIDNNDIPAMARKNASVAAAVGRKDLVHVWSLVALSTDPSLEPSDHPDHGLPWASHPFGRNLIKSLIDHYSAIHDVQTLAMLCCAFGEKSSPQQNIVVTKDSDNDYDVDTSSCNVAAVPVMEHVYEAVARIRRSNSWTAIYNNGAYEDKDPAEKERLQHEKNMKLLDSSKAAQYDAFKKIYSDLLYRWGLLTKRTEVLKYVAATPEANMKIDYTAKCNSCEGSCGGVSCQTCNKYIITCVICHISVKGTSSFCLRCGHGGHTAHLMEWFRTHDVCASGCGCSCLQDSNVNHQDT